MAADINLLTDDFRNLVVVLLNNCLARGIEMRPNQGVRTPFEQAKFWRQSRSIEEIRKKISELKAKQAPFLAHCIESIGPQHGDHVTNAIPGFSWHQWGEALDCFWLLNGKAIWDLKTQHNGLNGYMVYANEAKKLKLDAGFFWTTLVDAPHVQFRAQANPTRSFSIPEIDRVMQERFG
jgi:hypothetical protein